MKIFSKKNSKASENPKTRSVFGFFRRDFLKDRKSGFSLVEMLVAIGIFMSIMTIAISSLISIMGANKKAQAIKSTVDSVTFALENISRDMRIGSGYNCTPALSTKDCTTGSNMVQYENSSGEIIQYIFSTSTDNGVVVSQLVKVNTTGCTVLADCTVDLISKDSNVHIDNITFYVIGADGEFAADQSAKTQPRVIITASGIIASKGSADTTFNLQTNISQRVRR